MPQPPGSAADSSLYRHLWESSLDACSLLHCERDGAGHITDFVVADMNPRGAAALGLAKEAALGRSLCEVVAIQRGGDFYIDALDKPFVLNGNTIGITASIGISMCPADGTGADTLIRHADNALYRAKELGKKRYQYFSAMLDGDARGIATKHIEQAQPVDKVTTG